MNYANKPESINITGKNNKIFYFIFRIKDFILLITENKTCFNKNNLMKEFEEFVDKLNEVDLNTKEKILECLEKFIIILNKFPENIDEKLLEKIKIFLNKIKTSTEISTYYEKNNKIKYMKLKNIIFDLLKDEIKNKKIKEIIFDFFTINI